MISPSIENIIYIGKTAFCYRSSIVRIGLDSSLEHLACQRVIFLGFPDIVSQPTQIKPVGS